MERPEVSPPVAERDALRIEEFKLLQAETLQRLRMQGFLSVANLVLVFVGVVRFESLCSLSMACMIVGSCILWIGLMVVMEQDYNITLIAAYIKRHVYRSVGAPSARRTYWEFFRGDAILRFSPAVRAIMAMKYVAFFVPMLILDWFVVAGLRATLGWLIVYSGFVAAKVLITALGWYAVCRGYGVAGSSTLE